MQSTLGEDTVKAEPQTDAYALLHVLNEAARAAPGDMHKHMVYRPVDEGPIRVAFTQQLPGGVVWGRILHLGNTEQDAIRMFQLLSSNMCMFSPDGGVAQIANAGRRLVDEIPGLEMPRSPDTPVFMVPDMCTTRGIGIALRMIGNTDRAIKAFLETCRARAMETAVSALPPEVMALPERHTEPVPEPIRASVSTAGRLGGTRALGLQAAVSALISSGAPYEDVIKPVRLLEGDTSLGPMTAAVRRYANELGLMAMTCPEDDRYYAGVLGTAEQAAVLRRIRDGLLLGRDYGSYPRGTVVLVCRSTARPSLTPELTMLVSEEPGKEPRRIAIRVTPAQDVRTPLGRWRAARYECDGKVVHTFREALITTAPDIKDAHFIDFSRVDWLPSEACLPVSSDPDRKFYHGAMRPETAQAMLLSQGYRFPGAFLFHHVSGRLCVSVYVDGRCMCLPITASPTDQVYSGTSRLGLDASEGVSRLGPIISVSPMLQHGLVPRYLVATGKGIPDPEDDLYAAYMGRVTAETASRMVVHHALSTVSAVHFLPKTFCFYTDPRGRIVLAWVRPTRAAAGANMVIGGHPVRICHEVVASDPATGWYEPYQGIQVLNLRAAAEVRGLHACCAVMRRDGLRPTTHVSAICPSGTTIVALRRELVMEAARVRAAPTGIAAWLAATTVSLVGPEVAITAEKDHPDVPLTEEQATHLIHTEVTDQ